SRENSKLNGTAQQSLFGVSSSKTSFKLQETKPSTEKEKLVWEKELLGLYVSSHPLRSIRNILESRTFPIIKLIATPQIMERKRFRIGGIISSAKKILTKTGKPMLFMALEDLTDKIEVVVFPSLIENYPNLFQENKIVLIGGRFDTRNGERKFIAEEAEEIITT
ncbi:MAG: OB-fold nucleic acid binding domain-containing protein, partial [Candidatus Wildermuthbacteria bacterium]|nr:OB-fold nucleic acid binding domain-containing protein [Candidatus Wildermuthbacteria bacterium]